MGSTMTGDEEMAIGGYYTGDRREDLVRRRMTTRRVIAGEKDHLLSKPSRYMGGPEHAGVLGSLLRGKAEPPKKIHDEYGKSFLFKMLDPKSHSRESNIYKYSTTAIILFNMLVFVLETDDDIDAKFGSLFYAVEAFTSVVFLIDYVCRVWIVTEHQKYSHPVWGRVRYIFTPNAVIDAISTFPFFLEIIFRTNLPLTTPLRLFRLTRILKTDRVVEATSSVWRVIIFNREILTVAVVIAIILTLVTSTLLYYLQPMQEDHAAFESIPATIFMAVMMLTGQGSPEGILPWYTKIIIMVTAIFSVAMFAIPASMLTWGFEAEAERLARKTHDQKLAAAQQRTVEEESVSSDSDTDFGRWFFRGAPSSEEEDWKEYENVILGSDEEEAETAFIPPSVKELETLLKIKNVLLEMESSSNSSEGMDELKSLARELKGESEGEPSQKEKVMKGAIDELRGEVSQLRSELVGMRQLIETQSQPSQPEPKSDETSELRSEIVGLRHLLERQSVQTQPEPVADDLLEVDESLEA